MIVIVIGESVCRDYMSVYDYFVLIILWLNMVFGLFIDDYISIVFSIVFFLSWILIYDYEQNFDFGNNVVVLVVKVGYSIWWIFN